MQLTTYKQRKKEKTARKIQARMETCDCYLSTVGKEAEEPMIHDPFCKCLEKKKTNA